MSTTYGSKRRVSKAHYGIRDWLVQQVTAVLTTFFLFLLIIQALFLKGETASEVWIGIFSQGWMQFLSYGMIVAWVWHVWVGIRDIWMDYVPNVVLRLIFQVFTLVWLVGCASWGFSILWKI